MMFLQPSSDSSPTTFDESIVFVTESDDDSDFFVRKKPIKAFPSTSWKTSYTARSSYQDTVVVSGKGEPSHIKKEDSAGSTKEARAPSPTFVFSDTPVMEEMDEDEEEQEQEEEEDDDNDDNDENMEHEYALNEAKMSSGSSLLTKQASNASNASIGIKQHSSSVGSFRRSPIRKSPSPTATLSDTEESFTKPTSKLDDALTAKLDTLLESFRAQERTNKDIKQTLDIIQDQQERFVMAQDHLKADIAERVKSAVDSVQSAVESVHEHSMVRRIEEEDDDVDMEEKTTNSLKRKVDELTNTVEEAEKRIRLTLEQGGREIARPMRRTGVLRTVMWTLSSMILGGALTVGAISKF
ncbi:hypothetical protein BC829DRAFT_398783 [Chytridium lagenaria]|nr:hypothetical protein BC829DRAFT_398783 [Chytridium lagenaria]